MFPEVFAAYSVQVTSVKDQRQYWSGPDSQYRYVPVGKFVEAFRSCPLGHKLSQELAVPFNKHKNHPAALSTSKYGVNRFELLKIGFSWQALLMKRNSFLYMFKYTQVESLLLWDFI